MEMLQKKAQELRCHIVSMIHQAKSGHPGGALSAADLVTALYWSEMDVRPQEPAWNERDRLILSKGHTCPVIYAALAMKGYYDLSVLATLRKMGSILQGHPDMKKTPGLDMTSGSLGQGLSVGVGMALGARANGWKSRVYVILGDGEIQEGQIWEAAMSASKYQLDNLVAIIDVNQLQVDGYCSDIMPVEPIDKKWEAFGWEVICADGHDMKDILNTFAKAREIKGKPVCIVARTVKGKGVDYMEGICDWHGMAPNDEQCQSALCQIRGGDAQ